MRPFSAARALNFLRPHGTSTANEYIKIPLEMIVPQHAERRMRSAAAREADFDAILNLAIRTGNNISCYDADESLLS